MMICDDCNNCEYCTRLYFKDENNGDFYMFSSDSIFLCEKYDEFIIGGDKRTPSF